MFWWPATALTLWASGTLFSFMVLLSSAQLRTVKVRFIAFSFAQLCFASFCLAMFVPAKLKKAGVGQPQRVTRDPA